MVVQVVRVAIRPEERDRWLEIVRRNAALTRAEAGCQKWQVGEDLEVPNNFVIVEEWTTMEAQYDHFRRPEFRALMGSLENLLAEPPEVSIHEVGSTLTLDEALAAARS